MVALLIPVEVHGVGHQLLLGDVFEGNKFICVFVVGVSSLVVWVEEAAS